MVTPSLLVRFVDAHDAVRGIEPADHAFFVDARLQPERGIRHGKLAPAVGAFARAAIAAR